jgi:mannose-6-phosphate isomerase-like protein (cupin superfamily)
MMRTSEPPHWPTTIIVDVLLTPNPRRKLNRVPQKMGGSDDPQGILVPRHRPAGMLKRLGGRCPPRRDRPRRQQQGRRAVRQPRDAKPGGSGNPAANLWITDSSPPALSFKDDNAAKRIGLSPPDNGTAIRVVEFPPLDPATEAKMDPNFMMKVVGDHAPARGLPVKHPLMHRTRTVDYAVILSGEIDMMLDETTVHVKAGDVVIQQATNHAWVNRGTQPCRILFVLMDSKQP